MTAPVDDIPIFRFSTDELPERDRLAVMREVYGQLHARLDIEPVPSEPLRYRMIARALPGLIISSGTFSPQTTRRTRPLLVDGNDDLVLAVSPTGGHMLSGFGQELVTSPGDANLFSTADVSSVTATSETHVLNIVLRRSVLASIVPGLEDRFLRPISRENEALQLLTSYVRVIKDQQKLKTVELQRAVVSHVYDLVGLAFGATRDAAEIANGRGVRAARLHAIKTDILNGLRRHDLSLAGLAARHGVTPRYVQMLFESEGTTFSRFLIDQRLARAHRMLSDPRLAERTISVVAYEAGFGDLSHFNRAFRGRYGETPSDVRSSARRRDS
jgi:AraC-like DNA-binding protein